jgi:intracellular multiplication protein IcmK
MPTPLPNGQIARSAPIDLKKEALEKSAPLTPEEILELRRDLEERTNASNEPLRPIGKPVRRPVTVDLSPSATPEVVRSAFGQGTVVTFLDAAGRPWPVVTADNFNPRGLDVAVLGSNSVSIAVKSPTARIGNIAVQLEGFTSPVIFSVAIGQAEIDYSVEMQLPRYLPGAPAPVGAVESLPSLNAPELLNYLLGTIPKGARTLVSSATNVSAWQINSQTMIVRSDGLLASPRYLRRQSSANGLTVYELPISPRITLASQGQMQSVSLSGFEATKEQK